jgi:hypothetical protein
MVVQRGFKYCQYSALGYVYISSQQLNMQRQTPFYTPHTLAAALTPPPCAPHQSGRMPMCTPAFSDA